MLVSNVALLPVTCLALPESPDTMSLLPDWHLPPHLTVLPGWAASGVLPLATLPPCREPRHGKRDRVATNLLEKGLAVAPVVEAGRRCPDARLLTRPRRFSCCSGTCGSGGFQRRCGGWRGCVRGELCGFGERGRGRCLRLSGQQRPLRRARGPVELRLPCLHGRLPCDGGRQLGPQARCCSSGAKHAFWLLCWLTGAWRLDTRPP